MIVKFRALGQPVGLKVWGLGLAISAEVVEGLGFRTQQGLSWVAGFQHRDLYSFLGFLIIAVQYVTQNPILFVQVNALNPYRNPGRNPYRTLLKEPYKNHPKII